MSPKRLARSQKDVNANSPRRHRTIPEMVGLFRKSRWPASSIHNRAHGTTEGIGASTGATNHAHEWGWTPKCRRRHFLGPLGGSRPCCALLYALLSNAAHDFRPSRSARFQVEDGSRKILYFRMHFRMHSARIETTQTAPHRPHHTDPAPHRPPQTTTEQQNAPHIWICWGGLR